MVSRDRALVLAVLVVVLGAVTVVLLSSGALYRFTDPDPDDYGNATVTLADANGTTLASIRVRVADTSEKRYVGLSETGDLDAGEGMLFVHSREATHTYVMRNMSFPLDIVFVATNGTVTRIHHAPVPPPGTTGSDLERYPGRGKYVLELQRGRANATGLDTGDRVEIPDSV